MKSSSNTMGSAEPLNIGREPQWPGTEVSEAVDQGAENWESALTDELRAQYIAERAYYRAEARNFDPGHEQEDWVAAEADVEQLFQSPST